MILSIAFLSVGGCSGLFSGKKDKEPPFDALEMPTFETEDGKPKLVGDCTSVGNYSSFDVHGFGLVVNLPGTGGDDANTEHDRRVADEMNRRGISNIRSILASPQTAVVEIVGKMRPGIQAGDRFDVEILLPTYPQESNTKSLRGGILLPAKLTEMGIGYDGRTLAGSTRAHVEGPIMVDDPLATETSNPAGLKKGKILSGAVTKESRSLSLLMKEDSKSSVMADRIAKTINLRFYLMSSPQISSATIDQRIHRQAGPPQGIFSEAINQRVYGSPKGVATARSDSLIVLDVHPTYANDVSRYVRVIQSIACHETPVRQLKRIERLKEELQNPDTAQQAAFQLEAIGKAGIPALQQALKSSNMEVRFHAATSLAYLGDGTPAEVLADIARTEPAFRVYALNALSVMKNDLEAEACLQELLHVPSAETRYGAFRALKNRNPLDQTIRGEWLGGQFSYHGITSSSVPMVHFTSQKYPEIVLFGTDIALKQPFALDAGPTIYVNGQVPGSVVISRLATSGLDEKRTVSNQLDEIIRAVVDMKGTYPDVVQLIRQADMARVLPCRLEIDCLPEPNRIYRRQGSDESEVAVEEEEKPKSFWERLNPKNLFAPNPGEKSSDYTGTVNTSSRD